MEFWDIYDENKKPTGRTMKRNDWCLKDGEYHLTVLGVIGRPDGTFLITKRVMTKAWAPGWWEVSGGAAQAGEESYEAVLREVKEETGLDLEEVIESKVGNKLYLSPGMTDESVSLVYCTCSGEISTENLEEDEDIETILLSKEDAIKILNSNERCDIKFFMALQSFIINGEEIFK